MKRLDLTALCKEYPSQKSDGTSMVKTWTDTIVRNELFIAFVSGNQNSSISCSGRYQYLKNNRILIINQVNLRDDARYTCLGKNIAGELSNHMDLEILGLYSNRYCSSCFITKKRLFFCLIFSFAHDPTRSWYEWTSRHSTSSYFFDLHSVW